MNKSDLLERAALINRQMEDTKQQFVTLQAHLNECNFWLGKFAELENQNVELLSVEPQVENNNGEVNNEGS